MVGSIRVGLLALFVTLSATAQAPSLKTFEQLQQLIMQVSDRVKPAVVHVEVLARRGDRRRKGLGSGLILAADGTIVTNQHVIDKAEIITVILDDKSKFEARVLRQDRQTDLAILKIEAGRPLPVAPLADSEKVSVGEWVLAIGNPYGFDRTVSFGIVSGKGRYIPDTDSGVRLLNDFIQTDALIDPGSSGGPLVNLKGEVVGINSVGIGRGQGFTIPSRVVNDVLTRPQVEGRLERGWLGVYLQPFTRELAEYMQMPGLRGALVADVVDGSPAQAAGLRSGDILVSLDGVSVEADQDEEIQKFTQQVTGLQPGQALKVGLVRSGKPLDLTLKVGQQPRLEAREVDTRWGAMVKEITTAELQEYRLDSSRGAVVAQVFNGSAAEEAGLQEGDVVVAVDGVSVENLAGLESSLKRLSDKGRFLLTLRRVKVLRYALVDLNRFKSGRKD